MDNSNVNEEIKNTVLRDDVSSNNKKHVKIEVVQERLNIFCEYFVSEIEIKLALLYEILEGKSNKPGKLTELLGNATGETVAFIPAIFGYKFGEAVKKITKKPFEYYGGKQYKKKALKLSDIIYDFQNNKIERRQYFVEMAVDIFQSFEIQFMRVDADKGFRKAMKKLAKEAAYRILDVAKVNEAELSVENILMGSSKPKSFYGVPIPSAIKKEGVNLVYIYNDETVEWNSSEMYENIGITIVDENSNDCICYQKEMMKLNQYGFRRLFFNEDATKLNYGYIKTEPKSTLKPKFIAGVDYYKRQVETVLEAINKKKSNSDIERCKKVMEELKDDILNHIRHSEEESVKNDKYKIILNELKEYIQQFRIEECINNIDNYFDTIVKEHNLLVTIYKTSEDNAYNHREKISAEDKYEHEKTRALFKEKFKNISTFCKESIIKFLPSKPVKWFTGRTHELNEINAILNKDATLATVTHAVCITGLGGVGKTQLIRMFAHKFEDVYENIIYINAEYVDKSFNSIFRELKILNSKEIDDSENISKMTRKLFKLFDREEKTLFLYDNAEDYLSIKPYLPLEDPIKNRPHILITSRCRDWEFGEIGNVYTIHLGGFRPEEAIDYVKTALNLSTNSINDIKVLINELDYLPLALKQAVGYISQQNQIFKRRYGKTFSINDYVQLYRSQKDDLLKKGHFSNEDCSDNTVMTTWSITFEKIAKYEFCGTTASYILNIMAYLQPDNIEVKFVFREIISSDALLWESIDLLYKYSIIDLEKGVARIHRLVQEVIRANLLKENAEEKILTDMFVAYENINPNYEQHALVIWEHASKYKALINDYLYNSLKRGNTPLHIWAASRNDITLIRNIFKHIDCQIIDICNNFNSSPLYASSVHGHLNIVKYLFNEYMRHNSHPPSSSRESLYGAAAVGHHKIVEFFLSQIDDYDIDHVISSALERFQFNIIELLKPKNDIYVLLTLIDSIKESNGFKRFEQILHNLILKHGKDVLHYNIHSYNIFHAACYRGSSDIINLLLAKGVDVNSRDDHGKTPLFYTINNFRFEIVRLLIEVGADINLTSKCGVNPLWYSIGIVDDIELIKYLVENRTVCTITNEDGGTLLHKSAGSGPENILEYLLQQNIDINLKDNDGDTALHIATQCNSIEKIKLLLKYGADPNIVNEKGLTPVCYSVTSEVVKLIFEYDLKSDEKTKNVCFLHHAINSSDINAVKILLDENIDIDAINENNYSSLIITALNGDATIAEFLIEKGADILLKNKEDLTALDYAALYGRYNVVELLLKYINKNNVSHRFQGTELLNAVKSESEACVKLLLENGANPNQFVENEDMPMDVASKGRNLKINSLLLEYGADFNIVNDDGCSPIHNASRQPNYLILKLYLEKGIDPNLTCKKGKTPLHYAVEANIFDSVKFLLQNGSHINNYDIYGRTPLHYACKKSSFAIVCLLITHKADIHAVDLKKCTPLHLASKSENINTMNFLINKGAQLDVKNKFGETPLHKACIKGNIRRIQFLLNKGANPNIKDNHGMTPLHRIVSTENFNAVKLMIDKSNTLHSRDINGCTPLHYASNSCKKCVILLIEMGADPNCVDNFNKTPLHFVINQVLKELEIELNLFEDKNQTLEPSFLTKYLLDNGANPNINDNNGLSPIKLAHQLDNKNVINIMTEKGFSH